MIEYRLYIGGDDMDAASGETFESLNPTFLLTVGKNDPGRR